MLIDRLKSIVGPNGWTDNATDLEPHLTEWRGAVRGATPLMVSPKTTDEVAAVVRECAEAGVSVVPQGGNTGMCAGAVPDESGSQVILNLSRMNQIREMNPDNFSMIVEAGCILENLQDAARDVKRHFPLSLGAEGSCQIGGNLATNAGGMNVVRYGTARSLVLGLEVVLADGTIWNGLRSLRKDTAGYDLKQLFVGSEGTLGIITAASLRLFPMPQQTSTLLLAIPDPAHAIPLLGRFQGALPDRIEAFELISGFTFNLVADAVPNATLPFADEHPWYLLIEAAVPGDDPVFESILMTAFERELISDAILAKNDNEAEKLWRLRHSIAEAEKHAGKAQKHDISVPVAAMKQFLELAESRLTAELPEAQIIAFGHVGDGNLHYNVMLPSDLEAGLFAEKSAEATRIVYETVVELGGSISAEHGIGVLKKGYLEAYKNDIELELMRTLKSALDPKNVLNRGKVV